MPEYIDGHTVPLPWQIDGESVEKVNDFIFRGSKVTADGDFSYEIKTLTP